MMFWHSLIESDSASCDGALAPRAQDRQAATASPTANIPAP